MGGVSTTQQGKGFAEVHLSVSQLVVAKKSYCTGQIDQIKQDIVK